MGLKASDFLAHFGASEATFLGRGGFGETWRLDDVPGYVTSIAVKVLRPEVSKSPRVQREVAGLERFDHEGIVKLLDVEPFQVDGVPTIALICEHIDGGSVQDALDSGRRPNKQEAKLFAIGLLTSVVELHAADTLHRDLKPANVMLRGHDWSQPVVIDLGLVRVPSDKTITRDPARLGSLLWMSPEQLSGERARTYSDLWACGVILHTLLTGEHPFVDLSRLHYLDEDELYDRYMSPPGPVPAGASRSVTNLAKRFLTAEPLHARGTARRALNDLRGEKR